MKKTLLASLGLLSLAGAAAAQPFAVTPLNQLNVNTAPDVYTTQLDAVAPTIMWGLTAEATSSGTIGTTNGFIRTNNRLGTTFDAGQVIGSSGYEAFNISAIDSVTALVSQSVNAAGAMMGAQGGEILRTTNKGLRWNKVTTAAQFGGSAGFCNWVHMFDANEGVAFGDPNTNATGSGYEILRTTNGGTTWTRVPAANVPAPLTNEFGLANVFYALGNTVWAAAVDNSTPSGITRVYKSTDRGQTWTVSGATPLLNSIGNIAFRDPLNGIASNVTISGTMVTAINLIRTSDGGATWQTITPVNNATGRFHRFDLDAADGYYYSVGTFNNAATAAADYGFSYSRDGVNWTNINTGIYYLSLDVLQGAGAGSGRRGFIGANTSGPMSMNPGVGGVFAISGALGTRNAAVQAGLATYPNPSNGVFKVQLSEAVKAGTQVTVADALGRAVYNRTLNATTVGTEALTLDLSKEKAGVYTLTLTTDQGTATQKLAIQ